MFEALGPVFFFFGIGAIIGLCWALFYFGPKLIKLTYACFRIVAHVWKESFMKGWQAQDAREKALKTSKLSSANH